MAIKGEKKGNREMQSQFRKFWSSVNKCCDLRPGSHNDELQSALLRGLRSSEK